MSECTYKRTKRIKICTGDLIEYIGIYERSLQPTTIGQLITEEQFTLTKNIWSAIETVKGTRRFNQVDIDSKATHLFIARFDQDFTLLNYDSDNYFINFNERYFRIISVKNNNEQDFFSVFQTIERGSDTKEATRA